MTLANHTQEARLTKAMTVGQRRKRGRPRKEGPRQPNGQPSRISPERREDAQRTVVVARCKLMGWLPRAGIPLPHAWEPTSDMVKRAVAEHMGTPGGREIERREPSMVAELWPAMKTIGATYTRYWQSIGAPPPYAKAAMLTYLPEIIGSDGVEATGWDDRTEAEKVRAASNAMMRIEQLLGSAGYGVAAEVKGVVLAEAEVRDYARLVMGLRAVLG